MSLYSIGYVDPLNNTSRCYMRSALGELLHDRELSKLTVWALENLSREHRLEQTHKLNDLSIKKCRTMPFLGPKGI